MRGLRCGISHRVCAFWVCWASAGVQAQPSRIQALTGPWRFHLGDDPSWAQPGLDDSAWEQVDLTPAEGAHDADVGFTGYVAGWGGRGHPGATGFGWYRVRFTSAGGALAAPLVVDDAYELFVNGVRVLSEGDFTRSPPGVYSIAPRSLPVPSGDVSIALRVWMAGGSWEEPPEPDGGGMHTAPVVGSPAAIGEVIRGEWRELIRGYAVDAVEPVFFLFLAAVFAVRGRRWLAAALVLTAAIRGEQALFYWWQFETAATFDFLRNVVLFPLALGAWSLAWSDRRRPPWFRNAALALMVVEMVGAVLSRGHQGHLAHVMASVARFGFVPLWVGARGLPALERAWMALVGVGFYAAELSALGIPGIWFPFGTGVSRTQFSYAALILLLAAGLKTVRIVNSSWRRSNR